MTDTPRRHFTVSAIIFHKGKTLLMEHRKIGSWLCPGGHIEPNETTDEALIREVKEETGLDVQFIDKLDNSIEDDRSKQLHMPFVMQCELVDAPERHYHIDMVYLCKSKTDDIRISEESKSIGWFTKEELKGLKMFPNFRSLLIKSFNYMNKNGML
jgi:8-oxo-dGTP diphosphatase